MRLPELINQGRNADHAEHEENDAFDVDSHSRHQIGSEPMTKISATSVR